MLTDREKELLRYGAQLSVPHYDSQNGLDYSYFECPWCGAAKYSNDYDDVFVFIKDVEKDLKHEQLCAQKEYMELIERLTA